MNLNKVDTALVLTGLRILQEEMQHDLRRVESFPQIQEVDFSCIDLEYIDDLCERINCGWICPSRKTRKKAGKREVTINTANESYAIPEGSGTSSLGFDVLLERIKRYAADLGLDVDQANMERGSMAAYQYYQSLVKALRHRFLSKSQRCNVDLTPQLIGLEGMRVEVVDCYDTTKRFWVGKSDGFIPIHLEIAKRNSSGGIGVIGTPFKSVRVLEEHR
jgi:hypothetical protein